MEIFRSHPLACGLPSRVGWLARKPQREIRGPLPLIPSVGIASACPHTQVFYVGSEDQLRSSFLHHKHCALWGISRAPYLFLTAGAKQDWAECILPEHRNFISREHPWKGRVKNWISAATYLYIYRHLTKSVLRSLWAKEKNVLVIICPTESLLTKCLPKSCWLRNHYFSSCESKKWSAIQLGLQSYSHLNVWQGYREHIIIQCVMRQKAKKTSIFTVTMKIWKQLPRSVGTQNMNL